MPSCPDDELQIASIPDSLETLVLQILDGPTDEWAQGLRELFREFPAYEQPIRLWLRSVATGSEDRDGPKAGDRD